MSKASIKKLSDEELDAYLVELSGKLEMTPPTDLENKVQKRLKALELEEQLAEKQPAAVTDKAEGDVADAGDKSKFDTTGKRGPNLGTGKYAKQRIMEGADNKTILAEIHEKFPAAKTTMASIAYYRNKLRTEGAELNPDALRAQADKKEAEAAELRAQADKLQAALDVKADEEAAKQGAEATTEATTEAAA